MSEWKKYKQEETEEQKKQKWVEVLGLYHQGNENTYKKLTLAVSGDFKVVLSLTEGETKGGYTKINFQLSEQELIYLAEKLRHLFFKLGK